MIIRSTLDELAEVLKSYSSFAFVRVPDWRGAVEVSQISEVLGKGNKGTRMRLKIRELGVYIVSAA